MSYAFLNVCKLCQNMQRSGKVPRNLYYQFYSKSTKLRTITTSCLYHDPLLIKRKPVAVNESHVFKDEASLFLENIMHDVYDEGTFHDLKETYLDRVEEIQQANSGDEALKKTTPEKIKKKKIKKMHASMATYEHGNQLTVFGEQNVLAELDIYMYLGEYAKATSLFNYHRCNGHLYSIDSYNKIIHIWAAQKRLKNIQMLVFAMEIEGIDPTYQTYAGLLEACGNKGIKASVHVENILTEMASKDMNVKELFRESLLTKQQISSIFKALEFTNQNHCYNKVNQSKTAVTGDLDLIQVQIDQELKGAILIKSVEASKVVPVSVLNRSNIYQNIIAAWKKDFVLQMTQAQARKKGSKLKLYNKCLTYGCVLSPDELSDIVFDHIVPVIASQPQGVSVGYICRLLGDMIYTRFCLRFQEKSGVVEKVKYIAEEFCSVRSHDSVVTPRLQWKEMSDKLQHLPPENLRPSPWSYKIKIKAASVVLDILKKVATVDTTLFMRGEHETIVHALRHLNEAHTIFQIGILKFHPVICRLYNSYLSHVGDMSFAVNSLPMVIPPQPWHTEKGGGYLLLPCNFVRKNYKAHKLCNTSDEDGLEKIFDAANYVGNCAWKVNGKLLDIMIELFNGKGDMKLDIIGSDLMEAEVQNKKKSIKLSDPKARKLIKKSHHEMFALRMDLLYKLSVANHFRHQVLWIPNNLDFRGRIYPIAPHLSHIGNDMSRSMLMFAEGKKLGEKGFDWLKVHLVNVNGKLKKGSLEERIKYADLFMNDIMDSADNPLTGRKWWKNSSDPWQTLIACMEITDAIRSGDPRNFVSHLPVQQDGSCNGLQHYAALGRDLYGAKQVNLVPADKPQDVYEEVSNLVERTRQNDAKNGNEIAQKLEGKINRKVVKQTVMTIVYGVTLIGGRLQIEKQLKDLDVENDIIFKASMYIVTELFKSLMEMFTSARQIQDWLTFSAAQIALTGNCVEWVTPLNLLVSQPYHRKAHELISTPLQNVLLTPYFDYTKFPDYRKQKGAFPPNFIHSLDSSHMMMTALRCQKEKMVFTSVHDSFWTHGCDADKMNRLCREEFINLHKLPLLDDLKNYFDEKFSGLPLRKSVKDGRTISKFDDLPQTGSFDIDEVQNSVYFFS